MSDWLFAARRIRRNRTGLAAAVVVLAIGSAIAFVGMAVAESVSARRLPYKDSDQILSIWDTSSPAGLKSVRKEDFELLKQLDLPVGFVSTTTLYVSVTTAGRTERLPAAIISRDLFEVLGAHAAHGESIIGGSLRNGDKPVVILSSHYARRLGYGPGRELFIQGRPHRVAGVMAEGFWFPVARTAFWIPEPSDTSTPQVSWSRPVLFRLDEDETAQSGIARVNALLARSGSAFRVSGEVYRDSVAQSAHGPLRLLRLAVVFSLVLSILNASWLILWRVRVLASQSSVLQALGATRSRLLRIQLFEVLVIAGIASAFSAGLSLWALRIMPLLGWQNLFDVPVPTVRGREALLLLALTTVSAVLASVPSLLTSYIGSVRRRPRYDVALVFAQATTVCLITFESVTLLTSFEMLMAQNVGFDHTDFTVTRVIGKPGQSQQLISDLNAFMHSTDVENLAGGYTSALPLGDYDYFMTVRGANPGRGPMRMAVRVVSPSFFGLAGVQVLRGTPLTTSGLAAAAVVDAGFALAQFGTLDVVGREFRFGRRLVRVAGVVEQVDHRSLLDVPHPVVYVSLGDAIAAQVRPSAFFLLGSSSSGSKARTDRLTTQAKLAFEGYELEDLGSFRGIVAKASGMRAAATAVVLVLSVLAVIVMVVGLHGMLANYFKRTLYDLAVRVALGASPLRLAVVSVARIAGWTCAGIAFGLGLQILLGAQVREQLTQAELPIPPFQIVMPVVMVAMSLIVLFASSSTVMRAVKLNAADVLKGAIR